MTALYLGVSGADGEDETLEQIITHPSAAIETDAFSLGRGKPQLVRGKEHCGAS